MPAGAGAAFLLNPPLSYSQAPSFSLLCRGAGRPAPFPKGAVFSDKRETEAASASVSPFYFLSIRRSGPAINDRSKFCDRRPHDRPGGKHAENRAETDHAAERPSGQGENDITSDALPFQRDLQFVGERLVKSVRRPAAEPSLLINSRQHRSAGIRREAQASVPYRGLDGKVR